MIARGRVAAPKKNNTLPIGLHLLYVKDIYYAKNSAGIIMKNEDDTPAAIDVVFKNNIDQSYTYRFMLNQKHYWELESFCNAINVSTKTNSVTINNVVNKRVWAVLAGVYYKCIDQVSPLIDIQMRAKFRPVVLNGIRPSLDGDPAVNGTPGGEFVIYREVDQYTLDNATPYGAHTSA